MYGACRFRWGLWTGGLGPLGCLAAYGPHGRGCANANGMFLRFALYCMSCARDLVSSYCYDLIRGHAEDIAALAAPSAHDLGCVLLGTTGHSISQAA